MNKPNFVVSEYLRRNLKPLSRRVVELQYQQHPEQWERYGDAGFDHRIEDTERHLAYLAESILLSNVRLWLDYIQWAALRFKALHVLETDFAATLNAMRLILPGHMEPDEAKILTSFIDEGIDQLYGAPTSLLTYIDAGTPLGLLANRYLTALLYGNQDTAYQLVIESAEAQIPLQDLYLNVLQPAQYEIGRLWQENKISVAHEHYCTSATRRVMNRLFGVIPAVPRHENSLVVACVGGELHELGIRMVSDFFVMKGWDTLYLGANTPTESLLSFLNERVPDVLALSVTITTHLSTLREVIQRVREQEHLLSTRIIVGGYPFNVSPRLWREIGADGYAPDGARAVLVAEDLIHAPN